MKLRALKGQRTRVRNALQEEVKKVDGLSLQEAAAGDGLEVLVTANLLKSLSEKLETLNSEILQHPDVSDEDLEGEIQVTTDFDLRVRAAIAKVQSLAQANPSGHEYSLPQYASTSTPKVAKSVQYRSKAAPSAGEGVESQPTQPSHATVTPPVVASRSYREINIAPDKFDGNRARYNRFIALFKSWIGKFPDLTGQERLTVLANHLTGEPKDLIEALEPTDANYEVALTLLDENYARVDTEKTRILAELRSLPRVQNANDGAGLRRLLTVVMKNIASLTAMGVPFGAVSLMVKSSLEAALPLRLRQIFKAERHSQREMEALVRRFHQQISREHSDADASTSGLQEEDSDNRETKELIEFLRRTVVDSEDALFVDEASGVMSKKKDHEQGAKGPGKDPRHRPQQSTVAAVGASAQSTRKQDKLPCLFCEVTDHRTSKCPADIAIEERRKILQKLKKCTKCFRPEHQTASECSGPRFPCAVCKSPKHYTSMHVGSAPAAVSSAASSHMVSAAAARTDPASGPSSALMLTASAFIVNGGRRIPVRLFLDGGSSVTFIAPHVRRLIRDETPLYRATMAVQAFAGQHHLEIDKYKIRLASSYGDEVVEVAAYEHDFGVDPQNDCPPVVAEAVKKFGALHPLADRSLLDEWSRAEATILIGQDYLNSVMLLQPPEPVYGELRGFRTVFGWAIGGSVKNTSVQATVTAIQVACCGATLSSPAKALQELWKLDAIGIHEGAQISMLSMEDEDALRQYREGLSHDGQRYVVSFPKRASIANLSNNFVVATDRLEKKVRQLERTPEKYQRYHQEIMKFVDDGFAVEINDFPAGGPSQVDKSYYMPHHAVVTGNKPNEKWRIVFDCSAKKKGKSSLNDCLMPGPNLNPDLVTLLLNFRLSPVAVSTDITKAYMRIAVNSKDQRYFRFLWKAPGASQIKGFQMQRVTWGAASSGFLLAATLRTHFERTGRASELRFGDYLYADDFLRSFPSPREAIDYIGELRQTLQKADMNLAKWKTNSREVAAYLIETGVEPSSLDLQLSGTFKVLGITWNPREDTLVFNLTTLHARVQEESFTTKRSVLSLVASVYDPLGFLLPFTLRGKLLIQRLWTESLTWDEPISSDIRREVSLWANELKDLANVQVRRRYSEGKGQPVAHMLHVFGDASPAAYACAAYVEYRYETGDPEVSLVMCRSRISPKDATTLPRLELLAALIATRLKDFLLERLDIKFDSVSLYTDSMITYHWVTAASPAIYKTYVANRVAEIQQRSSVDAWFFVPGEHNVSDLATRGISAKALISAAHWWSGPVWLRLPLSDRPVSRPRLQDIKLDTGEAEMRATSAPIVAARPLLDLERFNSAARAARVLALVLRFRYVALKSPVPDRKELVERAENYLVRLAQSKDFAVEIRAVSAGERVPSSSKLAAFELFLEDGLLRARTRLTQGPHFTYAEKNPLIIAGESRFAALLIHDAHRANAHFGVSTVMNMLRRRFWITRGRQVIKNLLRKCAICRKRRAAAAGQIEAPLPDHRLNLTAAFATAGLDFCGPFYAKIRDGGPDETKAKKKRPCYRALKMYVALFSDASIRAIHLEVVPSQNTAQVHLALRRFLSVYPACTKIVSDNARSFVKAATDIKRLFNSRQGREVREVLAKRDLEWEFICPRAPWRGGFYERMVGTVKSALIKTLGRSFVGYEEFRTIVAELTAVVNDRPITAAPTDINEPCALTPAQFLRGGPQPSPLAATLLTDRLGPDGAPPEDELRERFRQRTTYFKHLAARWKRDYILQLRSANQTRGRLARPIAVGDVCLLRDDAKPRIQWELVRVVKAHPGRDGRVRTYTVRFSNRTESRRAAQLLCPLEAAVDDKQAAL